MRYKFNRPDGAVSEGYVTVIIENGLAEIDPGDADQVALAERLGGKPHKPAPKPVAPKRASSKKEGK